MLETFVTYKFYEICIKSISEFKVNTITMYFLYSANVFHIQYLYYLSYMYIYNLSNLTQVSADRRLFKKIFYIHFFSYINFIHDFFTNYTFSLSHYQNLPSLYLFYSSVFIKSREIFFQPKTRQIISPSDNGKISSFNTQWFFLGLYHFIFLFNSTVG